MLKSLPRSLSLYIGKKNHVRCNKTPIRCRKIAIRHSNMPKVNSNFLLDLMVGESMIVKGQKLQGYNANPNHPQLQPHPLQLPQDPKRKFIKLTAMIWKFDSMEVVMKEKVRNTFVLKVD